MMITIIPTAGELLLFGQFQLRDQLLLRPLRGLLRAGTVGSLLHTPLLISPLHAVGGLLRAAGALPCTVAQVDASKK